MEDDLSKRLEIEKYINANIEEIVRVYTNVMTKSIERMTVQGITDSWQLIKFLHDVKDYEIEKNFITVKRKETEDENELQDN